MSKTSKNQTTMLSQTANHAQRELQPKGNTENLVTLVTETATQKITKKPESSKHPNPLSSARSGSEHLHRNRIYQSHSAGISSLR